MNDARGDLDRRKKAISDALEQQQSSQAALIKAEAALQNASNSLKDCADEVEKKQTAFDARLIELGISETAYRLAIPDVDLIGELEGAIVEFDRDLAAARGRQTAARNNVGSAQRPDMEPFRLSCNQAQAAADDAARNSAEAQQKHRSLMDLQTSLADELKSLQGLEQASGSLRGLAEAFDGQNELRTTLETFAIGAMFDQVLEAANLRLDPMTGGRYRFAEPTTVEVAGIEFQGELLYYGKGDRRSNHRALVDPTLSVASDADSLGTSLGYWPNYSELTPSARRAYLEWLASGRCAPNAPIGYVFVYFYGLERRLIAEKSEQDAAAILAEARRLLDLYGDNHSFRNYCGALIEAGELIFEIAPPHNAISLDMRRGWEIPISIRVRLGRKVRDGIAIDSDDALCWALTHPQLYPRTAVSRCFDQFCALWRYRFAERFPDGIKVRGGKTRLQFNYRAASGEFNAHAELEDLPDIGAIAGPVTKLEALLTACTEELDPLSRFLGRNPEERATLLAAALCPAEALDDRAQTLLSAARTLLFDGSSKDGFAQNPVGKVLEVLAENPGELAADRRAFLSKRLPEILDAMQIGFEPDKRYGPAPTLSDDTMLCLFEMDKSIKAHQDRDEYRSARTMIEIAVLAAKADDQVVEAEMSVILDDVAQIVGLDSNDHQRLRAHAQALALNPSKMRAATNRLLALPEAEKDRVLTTAVRAILADQRVLPSEVRFLEGLYKSLGKSQDEVYARLHSGEGSPRSQRTGKNQPVHAVDGERLERLRRETAAVSTMLSGIFREEEPASAETAAQPQPDERSLPGLDAAHSHVLLKLSEQPVEIETFDTLCREQRLLPDGAIETINDWAFDALDDIAIECEDIVSIQPHLIDKIRSMAAA